ncbi:MAG: peptide chain release factor N(5)-glutamine methyltransferase [Anaerolineales bacterium]
MNIQDIIQQHVKEIEPLSSSASQDLQVLIGHIMQKNRSWVLAHGDYELSEEQLQTYKNQVKRFKEGVPLPYLLGEWEFYGHSFYLSNDVLIPRPETEMLVEVAIKWIQNHPNAVYVADVGTGSGCIAITLALAFPQLKILATDISYPALFVARRNIQRYHLSHRIFLLQTDLVSGIDQKFDIVCANLPYIPQEKLAKLQVAQHEPLLALNGGIDGMQLYRRLFRQLVERMNHPSIILCEMDPQQEQLFDEITKANFPQSHISVYPDLAGNKRIYVLGIT